MRRVFDAAPKKTLYAVLLLMVTLALGSCFYDRETYGNTPDTIAQVIESVDIFENASIELIEVFDVEDWRYVAFLSDGDPSFMEFEMNDRGNYEYHRSERRGSTNYETFMVYVGDKKESRFAMVSISGGSDLVGLTFKANEVIYELGFTEGEPSAVWTELEDTNHGNFRFEWYPEVLVTDDPARADVSMDMTYGADMVSLDYASEDLLIFHGYFGLFVYDLFNGEIVRSLDLMAIGCDATQGDDWCQVSVDPEGTWLQLHAMSSQDMYIYDIRTDRLTKSPYLPMEGAFEMLKFYEVMGEQDVIHSNHCVKFGEEDYGYLVSEDITIGSLSYVRGDESILLFAEDLEAISRKALDHSQVSP